MDGIAHLATLPADLVREKSDLVFFSLIKIIKDFQCFYQCCQSVKMRNFLPKCASLGCKLFNDCQDYYMYDMNNRILGRFRGKLQKYFALFKTTLERMQFCMVMYSTI